MCDSSPLPLPSLRSLTTETRNPDTHDIDRLPTPELLARINSEDQKVAQAVRAVLPQVAQAVDAIVAAFREGGRLIYIGAGTSGRLGVLDASECGPTFSVPEGMVLGIIAGGDIALRSAVEDAEDDPQAGAADLANVQLSQTDVVVGIAASGTTPYVLGALDFARHTGAVAVGLTANPGAKIADHADICIAPKVGPEVLTGSTRLKSGTAQKLILNMLTTASMIRSGKTYGNLMVDLTISNRKLQARAVGIICDIAGVDAEEASAALTLAGGEVKLALLMQITGANAPEGKQALAESGGVLRDAIARLGAAQRT